MRSTAAIFGAPVTDPPGNVARRISASSTPGRSVPSTVDTMCSTPASSCVAMSSGQRTVAGSHTRERSFRSRSTIITCSAASFSDARSSAAPPRGRVPLIGIVRIRSPRRARKSSGEAETTAQRSVTNASGWSGRRGARACRERMRVAGKRRMQVLDEIDLVDVAARDGVANLLDRAAVLPSRPRLLPHAGREAGSGRMGSSGRPDATRRQRKRGTRLGWGRRRRTADRLRRGRTRGRRPRRDPRHRERRSRAERATPRCARKQQLRRGSREARQACARSPTRSTSSR